MVTIGITPDRPETGYGYIKYGQIQGNIVKVERFVEKPDSETAKRYLEERKLFMECRNDCIQCQ